MSEKPEPGSVIALFHIAKIAVAENKDSEAVDVYKKIYENGEVKKVLRDLAKFKTFFLIKQNKDLANALLDELSSPDCVFNLLAQEQRALYFIETNDFKSAEDVLDLISNNPNASNSLISRAKELKEALRYSGK